MNQGKKRRAPKKVVDLLAVRSSLERLDAIAAAHPELTTVAARDRLAAAVPTLLDDDAPTSARGVS